MIEKTILIADDDSDLTDVLTVRCRELGLRVLAAYDGLTASTLISEQPPDLICLDVNMPLGNGMDLCSQLVSNDALAPIPVIVLTGRCDSETIRRCKAMDAHYVYKTQDVWSRIKPLIIGLLCETPAAKLEDAEEITTQDRFRGGS